MEPNLDVIYDWVVALESGRYHKVTGTMMNYEEEGRVLGHCCLGVVSDLYCQKDNYRVVGITDLYVDLKTGNLNPGVLDWMGIYEPVVNNIGTNYVSTHLAKINDNSKEDDYSEVIQHIIREWLVD